MAILKQSDRSDFASGAVLPIPLNQQERKALEASAAVLKLYIATLPELE